MDAFTQTTRDWFAAAFDQPTSIQAAGWQKIAGGEHALLVAPTGSGKTLAAFLWGIDQVARLPVDAPDGVRVLYISPLKALVYDIERNLRAPLVGIQLAGERAFGKGGVRDVRVDVRTGDTPQREREQQRRKPAEILVTTPESLFLMLGSRAREGLRTVHTVIIDEVHSLAPTKRGVHLALSLERLEQIADVAPQRIGLSATVRPADEVAKFLGGDRDVAVVDAAEPPRLQLQIAVPVADMTVPTAEESEVQEGPILGELYTEEVKLPGPPAPKRSLGIWPAIHPELVRLIRDHRSTIVFVNSRGLCERLAQSINEIAGEDFVKAHHGSVSHDKRAEMEDELKRGDLQGIVATSSLELGIDMGAVDLVILIESPGSSARGLQRVGRAGHEVGGMSRGIVFPKFRGDLVECTVIAQRMLTGELESIKTPKNCLDVLAQQIIAMVCDTERSVDDLERIIRRARPYRELSRALLVSVLDMLSGRYPSDDCADLRPRLSWDRKRDTLGVRRGTPMISRLNAGTIPDRGQFTVHAGEGGPRVGELDEEMVYESRQGDVIMLGASSWRIAAITRDRVIVEPAPGEPGRLPFWRGDGLGRPLEVGLAIGAFLRELSAVAPGDAVAHLQRVAPLDAHGAQNLADCVAQQREEAGLVPTDRTIVVERFRDELGDWRLCILTPFGSRVHAPWTLALQTVLSKRHGVKVVSTYTDDGIVLTLANSEDVPELDVLLPDPDELEELVTDQLSGSAMFGARFRENAARALLMPRRNPRSRSPLWAQRLKAKNLMAVVMQHADFPIVLETYRECLRDVFDLPGLQSILRAARSREIRVDVVETRQPSPFARLLVFAHVAAYLYEDDAPLAERRAHVLTLDRGLLRDLLGEAELRELIDAELLEQVELELQCLADERRARDADELHDVLRKLGALTLEELEQRSQGSDQVVPWLDQLGDQRRAVQMRIAGAMRWIAAQDAGRYRDALGAVPPGGLPAGFLDAEQRPLEALVRRYARTRGPFSVESLAREFGLGVTDVEPVLKALESASVLVRGEIRPGGHGVDWCDDEVLRRLRRQTLAKLRGQIAPVGAASLAEFLAGWQGVGDGRRDGIERLDEVIGQLEGLTLPWSAWVTDVLPARVPDFTTELLDVLAASGRVVWIGRGALGAGDGRVVLYRRESAALFVEPPADEQLASLDPLPRQLLESLEQKGASFLLALQQAARAADFTNARDVESALWDLVWAGLVTNDSFAPLRTLGARKSTRPTRRRSSGRGAGLAGGRWSRVLELADPETTPTERAHARASALLDRYGVVSRETAQAEELPGGFSAVYGVLKAMEESGRVRRGLFIEGLGGAQFAMAGAVDRLREVRDAATGRTPPDHDRVRHLAVLDPANPWGTLVAWPATGEGSEARPRRVAGAFVVLVDGLPAIYLGSNRRNLTTFPMVVSEEAMALAFGSLRRLPNRRNRSLVVEKIDGVTAGESPFRNLLESGGFVRDYRGFCAEGHSA